MEGLPWASLALAALSLCQQHPRAWAEGPSQGSPSRPPSPWTGWKGWAGTPRAHQNLQGVWGRLWDPGKPEGHVLADTSS